MEAVSVKQIDVVEAAEYFARIEGILPAPESSHAIRVAIDEAFSKETEEKRPFCLDSLERDILIWLLMKNSTTEK